VRDFSLAELSRRLGVSVAAPYRHFADREALLAAVAVRALGTFGEIVIGDAAAALPPADRLAAIARDYVRFAGERRPLFDTMFAAGIDKTGHPEVHRAEEPIDAAIRSCVCELCPGDPAAAQALESALTATAHGFATLLIDGAYGTGSEAVDEAARQAGRAALAIIAGRTALTGENHPPDPRGPASSHDHLTGSLPHSPGHMRVAATSIRSRPGRGPAAASWDVTHVADGPVLVWPGMGKSRVLTISSHTATAC
jgi:AcrR family transcriptional regulator